MSRLFAMMVVVMALLLPTTVQAQKQGDADNPSTGADNRVHDLAEVQPEFPGGQTALLQFISTNVKYPAVAAANGVQGKVIVSFIVERDGSISDVKILKGADPSLDKEAMRVIRLMPRWKPGLISGRPVRVKYTCPITFRL